jgi:hypothetical protein
VTYNYTPLASTAARLVEKFGQAMTLERKTNTGTASRPTFTTATSAVTAVILDKDERDPVNMVTVHRQMAYIAPDAATAPTANDIIIAPDGTRFEVVSVSQVNPGGTVILYKADLGTA